MARVRLDGVRKVYDTGAVAVHEVSLDIADGELVVLVGPSGCGKTTTLRMIAGLESLSGGRLYIGERLVNDLPPKARDIAMVFQNYALYPHMSVYENMAFALTLRKLPRAEIAERVRRAAEILGLEQLLDARPRQLSGGQRQRVAIGRAIVREPAVFLFDEPLSNLDAKLRVQMRREIAQLHQRLGATMVYVTHDQVEAMTLGNRIVVMRAGWVQQIGAPLELYDAPANTFVAGFIGSPAMNLLPGTLEPGAGVAGAGVTGAGVTGAGVTGAGVAGAPAPDVSESGVGSAGGLRFRADGGALELALTAAQARALAPRAGGRVVAGIRPEDIALAGEGGAGEGREPVSPVRVRLDVVEPLGNEILLHSDTDALSLTARVAPRVLPAAGDVVMMNVRVARLHFFDAETGARLPVPDGVRASDV